ncbi:putative sugar transferase EpsL [Sporomusa ovata DSM 2662]|uniref:Lipid carrier: UDP-N-acetylgalactosaminyltransferase n=1 Tax=Sporomusa ovata TaxID=2378 RepID=A0A0U1L4X6_9FIRM|nr:sugar transferase [Sporomusa ovata]EQB28396.1 putative sugar transferase EpsL [Sporomusa ovata DSM 2662]CQR74720.1 Lipid carrier : UDP-N-acetylgalactosaminyltransferase [Sporomusa ovata]
MNNKQTYLISKRVMDVLLSSTGLAIFFPLLLIIAVVIRFRLGPPILFRQVRPGLNCQPFILYKFRTMTDQYDENGILFADSRRLTKLGNFLRRTSLDELPELFNVVKGDMSLVGPRPLLMRYVPYYTEKENIRHSVRPGITGLAQISGRNHLCWDERLEMDIKYVEQKSVLIDLKILFKTIISVIKREGVVDAPDTMMLNLDQERSFKRVDRF